MFTIFRKSQQPLPLPRPDLSPLRRAIFARLDRVRAAGKDNPLISTGLTLVMPHLAQLSEADLTTMVDLLYEEARTLYFVAHPETDW